MANAGGCCRFCGIRNGLTIHCLRISPENKIVAFIVALSVFGLFTIALFVIALFVIALFIRVESVKIRGQF
jgi:hypothetical protein